MKKEVIKRLDKFRKSNKIGSQGSLSMILFLSRKAVNEKLPLDFESLKTSGAG